MGEWVRPARSAWSGRWAGMTDAPIQTRYDSIVRAARDRLDAALADKTRIIVQVGHCSASAGSSDLLRAIAERFGEAAAVTTAGCDGACYAAPTVEISAPSGAIVRFERVSVDDLDALVDAVSDGADAPDLAATGAFFAGQRRIALDGAGVLSADSVDDYLAAGGYAGLARALQMGAESVIREVKDSGLKGRGGAYFPAGLKWETARGIESSQRYMVVNCEEGEPGLFKDRHLMEGVPHRVIEGALIAAYASGAREVIFYINAEAHLSAERMAKAIRDARSLGLIGDNVLASDFDVAVEIRRGAGGYVCGDETTLLNTLEGYRREPRLKPPYPVESGLWAQPTVINNAETLACVPSILTEGAGRFSEIGDGDDTGSKIINLSGAVRRPGLIEAPFGTTLRQIIFDMGGGVPDGRELRVIGVGGPSSGIFPESMLETPIKPGFIHDSGVMLGAGAIIVIDDSMDVLSVIRNLAQYNANESCGKCTPCREGTPRMVEMIDSLAAGQGSASDIDELARLARLVNAASLCGLGQAAGNPILSGLHFFGDELGTTA